MRSQMFLVFLLAVSFPTWASSLQKAVSDAYIFSANSDTTCELSEHLAKAETLSRTAEFYSYCLGYLPADICGSNARARLNGQSHMTFRDICLVAPTARRSFCSKGLFARSVGRLGDNFPQEISDNSKNIAIDILIAQHPEKKASYERFRSQGLLQKVGFDDDMSMIEFEINKCAKDREDIRKYLRRANQFWPKLD